MSKFRNFSRFERLEREEIHDILPRPPLELQTNPREKGRSPAGPHSGYQRAESPSKAVRRTAAADLRSAALLEVKERLNTFTEQDFASPSKTKAYKTLRSAQAALEASLRNVPRSKPGKAKVFTGPVASEWPVNKSGTSARYSAWTSVAGSPQLSRKSRLLPCIERAARRAVLFSLGKNRGWHSRHRKNRNSWVPC